MSPSSGGVYETWLLSDAQPARKPRDNTACKFCQATVLCACRVDMRAALHKPCLRPELVHGGEPLLPQLPAVTLSASSVTYTASLHPCGDKRFPQAARGRRWARAAATRARRAARWRARACRARAWWTRRSQRCRARHPSPRPPRRRRPPSWCRRRARTPRRGP